MPKPKAGMTARKIKAAQMLADGFTLEQIGAEVGVDASAVCLWKRDDEFLDYADTLSKKNVIASALKARKVLDKHLEDKGAWVSMNAATNLLREYQTVKGIGSQAVIVTFNGIGPGQIENKDTDLPD